MKGLSKFTVAVFKVRYFSEPIGYIVFSYLVQERLTRQIAEAIQEAVEPHGVAVIIECV